MDSRTRKAKIKHEGKIFETKNDGLVKVLSWNNSSDIDVVFLNTGNRSKVKYGNLYQGTLKDHSIPSVYGVGIIGETVRGAVSERKYLYGVWVKMLERCYCESTQCKNPTYIGCTVSENFKNFPIFYEWCVNQVGFNQNDDNMRKFVLDKDILIKGNKIYSEDTCCFVPREINNLLLTSKKIRGCHLIGVYKAKHSGKYRAEVRRNGKGHCLGSFNTELEAFLAYKEAKEAYIKEVANKWRCLIDNRVYEALIGYEVAECD